MSETRTTRTTKTKVVQHLTSPGVKLVGAVWRDRDGRYWVAEEIVKGEVLVLSEVSPPPSVSLLLASAVPRGGFRLPPPGSRRTTSAALEEQRAD